ncbi:MAG: hypothetical protein AAF689_12195 [Pseudomonadota bacterium]
MREIDLATKGRDDILRSGGPWTFWAEWYDRAMAGDPLPWDLVVQIARIPDAVWQAGPEAVADAIDKIRARYDAAQAAKALRDQMELAGARPVPASFGGNSEAMAYDPHAEDLERAGVRRAEFDALTAAVARLARVADAQSPQEAETRQDAASVDSVLTKLLRYFARKLDMDFDAFRKGFWGAAGVGAFAALSGTLFVFAQALGALSKLVGISSRPCFRRWSSGF